MKVGYNSLWLVKSGGSILGPYTEKQIYDLLRDKIVVPLDEVSRPSGRWIYLRDEMAFKKIIEDLQSRNFKSLNDDSTTKSGGNDTVTQTELGIDSQPDDLTEEISQIPRTVQDVMFHSVDDKPANRLHVKSEVFAAQSDIFVKKQANQMARWLWLVTSIFIVVAFGFVVFQKFIAKPMLNKNIAENRSNEGIDALEAGDYIKALDLFSKAHAIDPSDSSLYLYLGILKIQIEDQPFLGRQIIEKLQNKADKDLKHVLTGIGLAHLKEGDARSAERYFNKALDIDPLFDQAVINLGASALYLGDWAKASNHLLLAVKSSVYDGSEIIMLTQAYIKLYEESTDKNHLIEALKYLKEFASKTINYNLEVSVASAYIEYLLSSSDKRGIYFHIDDILDMDYEETDNHRLNLFIHRQLASWSLVSSWCLKMANDLDPNAHVIAFESMCLYKAGDSVEASQKIEDALLQAPKDPLVLSTYAYIQKNLNSLDRATVSIEKALNNDPEGKYVQPKRLAGQICYEQNKVECEKKIWNEVLRQDQKSLIAIAAMARIFLAEKKIVEAKRYLARGIKISSSYKPFIKLSKSISSIENENKVRGL